jgi:hypothetical protein
VGLDADAWASFAHDPRDPAHAVLRAGDADRVLTANLLTEAYAEGRIDLAEHDERAELAQSARLLGDLVPLLDDLVPVLPPSPSTSAGLTVAARADLEVRAHQEWAAQRRSAVMGFIAPTLITWAVFVAIVLSNPDAWHFPWPLIVMAATGVNLLRVHVQRADIVADNLESLEKKRAKALAKQAKARRSIGSGEREKLDPEALRAASELARQKARDAARVVEQDVVRRFNQKFRPPEGT